MATCSEEIRLVVRVKIGDVIEVPTKAGLYYAQYTHKSPLMGDLIRVFDRAYKERAVDLEEVVRDSVRFSTFIPLGEGVKQKVFNIVGNAVVAPQNRPFPVFRTAAPSMDPGKPKVWWLWDGDKEWKIGELPLEKKKLSIRSCWNDTLLITRLEEEWRPETDLYGG